MHDCKNRTSFELPLHPTFQKLWTKPHSAVQLGWCCNHNKHGADPCTPESGMQVQEVDIVHSMAQYCTTGHHCTFRGTASYPSTHTSYTPHTPHTHTDCGMASHSVAPHFTHCFANVPKLRVFWKDIEHVNWMSGKETPMAKDIIQKIVYLSG